MPSADRRDKKMGVSGKHRLDMLSLMVKELFPSSRIPIRISGMELDRPSPTATVDTKAELEVKYPEAEFYFLVGSDIVGEIRSKWVRGEELWETARFLVIKRSPEFGPAELPPRSILLETDTTWIDVSSTFVRKLISADHNGIPYIAKGVADYICDNKLYRRGNEPAAALDRRERTINMRLV